MSGRPYNVLFLCTGNSARSILAEAILSREGEGRFRAWSAGSFPRGAVHPMALRVLSSLGHDTAQLRSKSWEEFASPGAPKIDFIFTVCDNAADEACPIWPGRPVTAHWGIPDPANVEGEAQCEAFLTAHRRLSERISRFLDLPLESLDADALKRPLQQIGETEDAAVIEQRFSRLPVEELAEVTDALDAAGLPTVDIDGERMNFFRLADDQGVLGWAALERHGPDALLRSVLTVADHRSSGIGSKLVRQVSVTAANEGVERLWLLTETAAPFFAKLGFAETERRNAPAAMLETTEFRSVCPASATCMTLALVRS